MNLRKIYFPIIVGAALFIQGCVTTLQSGIDDFNAGRYDQAADQLNSLAIAGDPIAQNYLGLLWLNGHGKTARNPSQALIWFTKAAQQGEPFAVNNIGVIHQYGHGVDIDIEKAIDWYTLSARMGVTMARTNLAALGADIPRPDLQPQISDTYQDAELAVMLGLLGSIGGGCGSGSVGSVTYTQCK